LNLVRGPRLQPTVGDGRLTPSPGWRSRSASWFLPSTCWRGLGLGGPLTGRPAVAMFGYGLTRRCPADGGFSWPAPAGPWARGPPLCSRSHPGHRRRPLNLPSPCAALHGRLPRPTTTGFLPGVPHRAHLSPAGSGAWALQSGLLPRTGVAGLARVARASLSMPLACCLPGLPLGNLLPFWRTCPAPYEPPPWASACLPGRWCRSRRAARPAWLASCVGLRPRPSCSRRRLCRRPRVAKAESAVSKSKVFCNGLRVYLTSCHGG